MIFNYLLKDKKSTNSVFRNIHVSAYAEFTHHADFGWPRLGASRLQAVDVGEPGQCRWYVGQLVKGGNG